MFTALSQPKRSRLRKVPGDWVRSSSLWGSAQRPVLTAEVPKKKPGPAAGVAGTPSYSVRCAGIREGAIRSRPTKRLVK